MSTYTCPDGHDSTDPDFCSVCNVEIKDNGQSAVPAAPAPARLSSGNPGSAVVAHAGECPDCHEPHDADEGQYCLTCGYDFINKQSGIPMEPSAPAPVSPARATTGAKPSTPSVPKAASAGNAVDVSAVTAPPAAPPVPAVNADELVLIVTIDPNMLGKTNPNAPPLPPRSFNLSFDNNILGRTAGPGVVIVVQGDAGISRAHLDFVRQDDGGFKVKDLGSSNGTDLNDGKLVAHAEYPLDRSLQEGDVLKIGEWTKITIKKRG